MNDFKRTLVVLAAASTFGIGGYTFVTGAVKQLSDKVEQIFDLRQKMMQPAESSQQGN